MKHPAVTYWLHDRCIDASYADSRGETFLHQAVKENVECVQRLIDLGVKPDSTDKTGWSVLNEALSGPSHTPIVKLLLDRGAKGDTKTHSGWSILHTAVSAGQMDHVSLRMKLKRVVEQRSTPEMTVVGGIKKCIDRCIKLPLT